jgi:Rha family phage regulatory protein
MQMPPEKGKAPVGGTTEALSEVTKDANQGNIMSDSKAVQVSSAITPDLQVIDGSVTTTSQQVAAHFGKRHADVMRAIRKMEIPSEDRERNFALTFVEVAGPNGAMRKDPSYRITRDGFTLLAMGFTGKEAMQWKLAYLAAFNKMEKELLARTTRPHNPAIDYDRISPAQAQDLKEIVDAIVKAGVQGFGETWARLHKKFRVNSYLELPATRHLDARKYLIGKLPRGAYEGVVLDAEPAKPQDSELLKSAFSLATEVAASAMRTVFDAVIDGKDVSKWDRWMFCLNHDREGKPTIPWAKPIQSDAMVVSMKELPTRILEPNGMMSSDEELANLASACTQRLAARAAFRMKQDSGRLTTV